MDIVNRALKHITAVAKVPSFSSYEERLHPHVHEVFSDISNARIIHVPGNSIIYRIGNTSSDRPIALTAHLDKINHYGRDYPRRLPVETTSKYIEGAMDNSLGVGILLTIAELSEHISLPDMLFFFSEMEEKKGLNEYPELLKNKGEGYESGMGARNIAHQCLNLDIIPDKIITVDTTPLFKGEPGVALYSKHWELNDLEPSDLLKNKTKEIRRRFKKIYPTIKFENNTNDYLHYGQVFNESGEYTVPSVALEPAIFPYHQKGEQVYIEDIEKVLNILKVYLSETQRTNK